MKTTDVIRIGSEITTWDGYLEVIGYNGHIVETVEWNIDRDGEITEGWERRLTLSEIAHIMTEVDGRAHKVRFEESEEDE